MSGDEPVGPADLMDRETMQAIEPRAGSELERTLARYARLRLEPGPAQARRARAAVMEAAWRARIEAGPARRRRAMFAGWSLRRFGTATATAVLAGLIVGSAAFATSRAGGPLYGARIAVEDMTLPTDPAARLEAQIAHAQARLAEASQAEARHDDGALAAAIAAYGDSVTELETTTGPGAGRALEAVQFHLVVLQDLLTHAPDAAVAGLTRAVAASNTAIAHLAATETRGKNGGGSGSGTSGSGGGGAGSAGGAGNANGGPGAGNGNGNSGAGNGNGRGNANGNGGAGNANGNGGPAATASAASTSEPAKPPKPGHAPNPSASAGQDATPTTAPGHKPPHAP